MTGWPTYTNDTFQSQFNVLDLNPITQMYEMTFLYFDAGHGGIRSAKPLSSDSFKVSFSLFWNKWEDSKFISQPIAEITLKNE